MVATRPEAAEKTDAGRVAPIRACVFYQIDWLKSGFEAKGRTVMPGNCALMGATRLASGIFSSLVPRSEFKAKAHRQAYISAVCAPLCSVLPDSKNFPIIRKGRV